MRPLEWVMLSAWKSVLRSCWRYPVHQLEQHVHGDLTVESLWIQGRTSIAYIFRASHLNNCCSCCCC